MYIDQFVVVVLDEPGAQYAHEAGQHYQRGFKTVYQSLQGTVVAFRVRVVVGVQRQGVDIFLSGIIEAAGIGAVTDHCTDNCRQFAILDGVQYRSEIGTAA